MCGAYQNRSNVGCAPALRSTWRSPVSGHSFGQSRQRLPENPAPETAVRKHKNGPPDHSEGPLSGTRRLNAMSGGNLQKMQSARLARIGRLGGMTGAPSLALDQPQSVPPAPRQIVPEPPLRHPRRKRRQVHPFGRQRFVSDLALQARRARQRHGRPRGLEATGDRLAPRQAHQGNEGERPDQL